MSVKGTHTTTPAVRMPDPNFVHPEVVAPESTSMRAFRHVAAALRLSIGWIFLWTFLDKLFGLGYATPKDGAWLDGGSPTEGFLAFGTKGPLADFYQGFAGAAWADWLFMLGLAGIGTARVLGVAMRIAAGSGALMLVLMWSATLLPENNPFMDDHLVYALVLVGLALVGAGRTLGLGKAWEKLPAVRSSALLK